jgi:biotin operon repressor
MSGVVMKWARAQRFGSMPLKALVNAIAARADPKGTTWVSQATLAEDIGASDRHVRALLARLERLGIIVRVPRSAGRKGRLTDSVTLAMHRKFDLSPSDVRAVLSKPATGTRLPLEAESSNRNKSTLATGTRVPGNIKRTTYPSQGEEKPTYQGMALPPGGPRLVVVGGQALEDGQ